MSTQPNIPTQLDLDAIRAKLASAQGPAFWRSLEEVAETPEFQALVDHEFTAGTSEWTNPASRRRMLQLLGASLGLAGLTACTKQPPEKIVPYVNLPEDQIPGVPLFFATALPLAGYGQGVLVESHQGRPTKVEGNPEHPDSLGSTDTYRQAMALQFWDPDRSQSTLREGRMSTWTRFQETLNMLREQLLATKGEGFRLLTETVTSPTLYGQIKQLLTSYPQAKWYQFEPVSRDSVLTGTRMAFGEPVNPVYNIAAADVIVSLDADFMYAMPGSISYARQFVNRRKADVPTPNRLYVIEPTPSITGAKADHRLAATSAEVEAFARALAAETGAGTTAATTKAPGFLKAIVADLNAHKGASLVIAGEHQPPVVHALAAAINGALGNIGKTVTYTEPVEFNAESQYEGLKTLVGEMNAGQVNTIIIVGGNPMYSAPADLKFADAFRKVKVRIHLGEYEDETAAVCHWHVPRALALESWGDIRAYDGTVTVQQPLIQPLYEGRSLLEVIGVLLDKGGRPVYDVVKEYWQQTLNNPADFGNTYQKVIHDGVMPNTALAAKNVAVAKTFAASLPAPKTDSGVEINIRPCPSVFDGRFTNVGWLQELPRPMTKLVWDNAVLVSPAMSQKLGVKTNDVVELRTAAGVVKGPIFMLPGQADDAITVHLGYGRTRGGKIANGVGFNANLIRTASAPWVIRGEVKKTGDTYRLVTTQDHSSMENRNLVRFASFDEFKKKPDFAQEPDKKHNLLSLYPEYKYEGYSWGMAIDLNACIGCNACSIACQAENNIPVVGKDQVSRNREMHWIRVDRYFEGSLDNPEIHHQPVTCMHCDNAPCEPVCPVAATSHSDEGLNQMTYNRCVGTRYCSNNCPYKVRRFNFFLYNDWDTQSLMGVRNPDVTVRSRGVMEKCTYCVQRINQARIPAEIEGRRIKDGEVVTACQQVCPTQAIVFGNMNDPNAQIARVKKDNRNYGLLVELNTRPRTSYLAKLRNPNPEIEKVS
ncbi:MAG: TAT-variant-translocated molybdopterin oxidoreductase [Bryobacterales bacterium]|nr:TAT-variant-translocated molybdopterin oxidoreductase [Bryobacterales bacterium]